MSIKMNQRGDTIVEVMLAIAIVGLVLGASYATATRALRTGRFAQEQTEALKLAESQIEKLKYVAGTEPVSGSANDIYNAQAGTTTFCIDDSFNKILASAPTFTSSCNGRSGLYDQLITYTPVDHLYIVNISWDRPTAARGNVEVSYRLFK